MGIGFENGNLVVTIEQEIPIFIPEADFSLPSPPAIPEFSFPELPDAAQFALKMKADLDAQLKLQGAEPSLSLKIDGGSAGDGGGGGGGGGGGAVDIDFPKSSINIETYLKKFALDIPTPNLTPSFDFPQPPDIAAQALKIKADLDAQLELGNVEPRISLDVSTGGGSDGGGGGGPSLNYKQPDFKLDIEAELAKLSPSLPSLSAIPSFDFPSIPDFTKFGSIDADIDSIKSELNAPGIPGVDYNPGGAIMRADVYLKSKISRVKVI